MKRIIVFIVGLLFAFSASADHLKGRVLDAETKEPLPDAEIPVEQVYCSTYATLADSTGLFYVKNIIASIGYEQNVHYVLTINYFGYHETRKKGMLMAGKDTIDIGDILLKPSEELMKELEVKGRMRRFYMKGDTVVYNPEAFHLEEGARLQELIRKLPGVSVQDGKFYWNGKPLKMKMNGQDSFGEDLLGMLPAEAAEKIKVYEKKSEESERLGTDDGQGDQVLDVVIKPGFMEQVSGNAEVGAFSNKQYVGTTTLYKLSNDNPWMLFGRLADHSGWSYTGGGFGRLGGTIADENRQQMGQLGYQHNWDSKWQESRERNRFDIGVAPNHNDNYGDSWNNTEIFMQGAPGTLATPGSSTFRNTKNHHYNHGFVIPVSANWYRNLGPKLTMRGTLSANYDKKRDTDTSIQQVYDDDPEGTGAVPVNALESKGHSDQKNFYLNFSNVLTRYLEEGSWIARLDLNGMARQTNSLTTQDYHFRDNPLATQHDEQTGQGRNHEFHSELALWYDHWFKKTVQFKVGYQFTYQNRYDNNERMRGDGITMLPDQTNSLRQRQQRLASNLSIDLTENVGRFVLSQSLNGRHNREWLDYHRGTILDTLARRSTFPVNINASLRWRITKASSFNTGLSWRTSNPDMISTLPYLDDSNPLYIRKGNSHLKGSETLDFNLGYDIMIPRGEQSLNFALNVGKDYNPTLSLYTFDPSTGAYTVTEENGKGGHSENFRLNYDRHLFADFSMRNSLSLENRIRYGFLTHTLGSTSDYETRQRQLLWREAPSVSYDSDHWNAELYGNITYRGSWYNTSNFIDNRIWDWETGLEATYKLKHWTFGAKSRLIGGNGYLGEEFNKTRFLMDANITWKCLKGKGNLTLEANDIFNQDTPFHATVTASERTESGRTKLHHYIGFTFKYQIDPKEKNTKK